MSRKIEDLEKIELLLEVLKTFESLFYSLPEAAFNERKTLLEASSYLLDHTMISKQGLQPFMLSAQKLTPTQALELHKKDVVIVSKVAPVDRKRIKIGVEILDDILVKMTKLLTYTANNEELTVENIKSMLNQLKE